MRVEQVHTNAVDARPDMELRAFKKYLQG